MDFTANLADQQHIPVFEIMKEDKNRVIMLINYYLEKSGLEKKEEKPKVNDGFFDF